MNPASRNPASQCEFHSDPVPRILHLGCGKNKEAGAFGVDRFETPVTDLVWNLEQRPWPLPPDHFERVVLIDVLEHLDDTIGTLEEVYRVSRNGADVIIHAPFAASHHLWTDPTHKRGFTSRSFKYFTDEFANQHFEYSKARFNLVEVEYDKHDGGIEAFGLKWYDKLLLKLANRRKFLYERRFMYLYPAQNIYFHLRVKKS